MAEEHMDSDIKDKDLATVKVDGSDNESEILTRAQVRRLTLKLDLRVLSVSLLLYIINNLDRASLGNAGAYGFRRDIGATGNIYNIGLTVFYIIYAASEVPSNLALKALGARRWLPVLAALYGVITLATTWIHNPAGFMVVRILLGAFEGGTLPGISYLLASWYPREQLASRMGIFLSGGAWATAISALLSTAYISGGNIGSITGWRKIFFINSMLTFASAIMAWFLLPDAASKTRMLNEKEREYVISKNSRASDAPEGEEKTRKDLVWRAFKHPVSYFGIAPWFVAQIVASSTSYFLPQILRELGPYSGNEANLRTSACYFVGGVYVIFIGFLSSKVGRHAPFVLWNFLLAIMGFAIFAYAKNSGARYAGVFLATMSNYGAGPVINSWVSANTAPYTTRAVTIAIMISFGSLGGVVGSWIFIARESPRYQTGSTLIFVFESIAFVVTAAHWYWCHWENKQREQGKRDWRLNDTPENVASLGHLHPSFRFVT